MMDIPIIVSTVLLAILLPTVAYVYITTPTKEDFRDHLKEDHENFREIRGSIQGLASKIDAKFDTLITIAKNGK